MADAAAHLCDDVLPHVPIRQWVLSLPFRVRYLLAYDAKLCAAVRRIFVRTLLVWLRERAASAGVAGGQSGAVVLAQVFGVELAFQQQVLVVVPCIFAAIGAAGVPGGSLPVIMIVMTQVGLTPPRHRDRARRRPLARHGPHGG